MSLDKRTSPAIILDWNTYAMELPIPVEHFQNGASTFEVSILYIRAGYQVRRDFWSPTQRLEKLEGLH